MIAPVSLAARMNGPVVTGRVLGKLSFKDRLRMLTVPMPQQARAQAGWPDATVPNMAVGGARDGVIYMPEGRLDRSATAHETFHLLDQQDLSDADRATFSRIMGAQPGPWVLGTGLTHDGLRSPNEWAADWYSMVANRVDPRRQVVSTYAPMPTRGQLLRFARALDAVARADGLGGYRRVRVDG